MSILTGVFLVDAPASALNNAGKDLESRTDNAVAVKFIRTPEGRYPYVSAQAVRYWLRTQLAEEPGWRAAPVFRATKIAFTDADPTQWDEDDLFGYMRAESKSTDEKRVARRAEIAKQSTPVETGTEVTRVSPLRVGTLVSVTPARTVSDFGTMARAEGDAVPHQHQFYRAHLKAPLALDLTAAGTFYQSQRVGYKNLDKHRVESAQKANAQEVEVRGFKGLRLPLAVRQERVAKVVDVLGRLEGGAKQTLHLTDTAPAVLVLGVCRGGNQPFQRLFTADEAHEQTVFRPDVFGEVLDAFGEDMLSDIYFGWATGFLDAQRKRLEEFRQASDGALAVWRKKTGHTLHVGHPRVMASRMAAALKDSGNSSWFD